MTNMTPLQAPPEGPPVPPGTSLPILRAIGLHIIDVRRLMCFQQVRNTKGNGKLFIMHLSGLAPQNAIFVNEDDLSRFCQSMSLYNIIDQTTNISIGAPVNEDKTW